jgi:hypothetical protein
VSSHYPIPQPVQEPDVHPEHELFEFKLTPSLKEFTLESMRLTLLSLQFSQLVGESASEKDRNSSNLRPQFWH